MEDKNITMARRVAEAVDNAGGCTYYVGGFVRDRLMGVDCKDVDIEVHGIVPQKLIEILDGIGEHTEMGASFGIYGLRHYELDIAMPRSERAIGRGHKDFEIFTDPFLGAEKAAKRRDFTINAMMENVLTGEVSDFFGGREDLKRKLLRHVDDVSFSEDPLRVLRCAQFAARFGFSVDAKTAVLCGKMGLTELPRERIMGELEKALLKAERPSAFFAVLDGMGQLDFWFGGYAALSEKERAETDALLDVSAKSREKAKFPLYFMLSALCRYMPDAKGFAEKLSGENGLLEYTANMCALRGEVRRLCDDDAPDERWNILFDKSVCPEDLLLLADALNNDASAKEKSEKKLAEYRKLMARPYVMGRDLIAAGLKPDKNFSDYLKYAHTLRLRGTEKNEALKKTLEYARNK